MDNDSPLHSSEPSKPTSLNRRPNFISDSTKSRASPYTISSHSSIFTRKSGVALTTHLHRRRRPAGALPNP
ncbi:hypothetical protein L484_014897 [Morus notabilis]|uniref:Uncharacterized protein n=1 Tax=Morus notabilis TaxID=981085 RepID=W9R789_9ROSA|nr:hypothetical protein L484_014897 [Morus notabilis]